jgi:hypothetical protein
VTGAAQSVTASSALLTGNVNADGSVVGECHFSVSPAPPGGASVPCAQQVGAGSTPVAVSAALAGLAPASTYTVTLVAASAQGASSGAPVTFTTAATAPGSGAGAGAGAGAIVTNLRLAPTRFRRGKRAATIARARGLPSATRISFGLSSAANVTLTFQRAQPGVLAGHKCVAPSRVRHGTRRCTRYAAVPHAVVRVAHAGTDTIGFDGVLDGGSRLAPGVYRVVLAATTPAAVKTSAPQHPSFTLLP